MISLIFLICDPSLLNKGFLLSALLPISTQQYWYLCAYMGLFIFMPLLNDVLNHMNKNGLRYSILSMFLLFSLLPTLLRNDLFYMNYGYSMLWLIVLYLIGGYIRLYGFCFIDSKMKGLLVYSSCVLITWIVKYLIEVPVSYILGDFKAGGVLVEYTSTTILFCGIGLLVFFSHLKLNEKMNKIIHWITPSTFSVYLIHEYYLIRDNFISGRFVEVGNSH